MKFSYSWIKEYAKTELTAQDAAELLSAKSFEVKEAISANEDTIFDIDILPNRPDALSHAGIARELAALTGADFKFENEKLKIKGGAPKDFLIKIENKDACARYSALVVRGVTVGKSPQWLAERLVSLGLKSINNVVDATNYVMLATGQPLHAFDLNSVDSIVVRNARTGEKLKALDDAQTEYELDPSILVIADSSKPLAIAGIKGGANSGITGTTKDILIEAANFSPESIRATSRKLRLRTDASVRFSYGVDPELTLKALAGAAELIGQLASGKADAAALDVYSHKPKPLKLKLQTDYVRSLLGEKISNGQIADILKKLGFGVTGTAVMTVTVPSLRLDVSRPEDLIEEVGRVYGYENITPKAPVTQLFDDRAWVKDATDVPWDGYEFVRERNAVARILANLGYSEAYNYSLISDELKESFSLEQLEEVESPQSQEYRYLRPSLIPRLVLNVRDNFRFADTVRLFETGHRFPFGKPERSRLALVLAGKKGSNELFFELKSIIDLLHQKLGIWDIWYDDTAPFAYETLIKWCEPGRAAEVKTDDGQALGAVGILNPIIAERFKIKGTVAFAEFDLKTLIEHLQKEREFEPLPKYPSTIRDISILVKPEVRISEILSVIENADTKQIVRDVDVFDIYEPSPSEHAGRHTGEEERSKSVAFHVLYRSDDHTLTDAEAESVEKEIKRLLEEKLDVEIR